jgi:hypothetical protein
MQHMIDNFDTGHCARCGESGLFGVDQDTVCTPSPSRNPQNIKAMAMSEAPVTPAVSAHAELLAEFDDWLKQSAADGVKFSQAEGFNRTAREFYRGWANAIENTRNRFKELRAALSTPAPQPPLLHWAARLVRAVVMTQDDVAEPVRKVALEMRDWLREAK